MTVGVHVWRGAFNTGYVEVVWHWEDRYTVPSVPHERRHCSRNVKMWEQP